MYGARAAAAAEREAFEQWSERLTGLGALRDDEDGHLYEWLNPPLAGGIRGTRGHAPECQEPPFGHAGHAPGGAAMKKETG